MVAKGLFFSIVRACCARTALLFVLSLILLPIYSANVNVDTPNLSFEKGNFSNWSTYNGWYYYDETSDKFVYEWEPTVTLDKRFTVMNRIETPDTIVSCDGFNVIPSDLTLTARIGQPLAREGFPNTNDCRTRSRSFKAAAERMTYSFIVTENSSLLNYRFACVLHVPDNSAHTGEQLPKFEILIHVVDPVTNMESTLPCASYSASANNANSGLKKAKIPCLGSAANGRGKNLNDKVEDYVFRDWTTASVNLQDFIGYKVTIEIINHDCLVDITSTCSAFPHAQNVAGGHESYGYFWAETRKLELVATNCGEDDPVIVATDGFRSYEWSRSDGRDITADPSRPNRVVIPRGTLNDGVEYSCKMSSDMCSAGTVTTDLKPVKLNLDFLQKDTCGGKYTFTNKSTCEGDTLRSYTWSLGDGSYQYSKDAEHTYASKGDVFTVKLFATSGLGCVDSVKKDILVPYVPTLAVGGDANVCRGDSVTLTVLDADEGSKILWDDGTEGLNYKLLADTSRIFKVSVTDKFSCTYTTTKDLLVRPKPVVYIKGDTATCIGDSATLKANNALTYSWSNGMAVDSIVVRPQETTVYEVVGTASNGCSGKASIKVNVNPLPTISIDGPTELCSGEQATLVASGGVLYQWDDLFTGGTREISPTERTTYGVRVVDANKCSNTAKWTVAVKERPIMDFSGETTVCSGYLAQISVGGAETFKWFDGSDNRYFSKVVKEDTIWKVEGFLNGCSATLEIPITIKPSPYVYIGGNPRVCICDTLTLWGKGAETYLWATGHSTDTVKTVPDAPKTYQVTGTAENGCSSVATIDVSIISKPQISVSGDASVCKGTFANLKASGECVAYTWSNTMQGEEISALIEEQTTFTVTGLDLNGCTNTASFIVTPVLPPNLEYMGDTIVCLGQFATLGGKGAVEYIWQDSIRGEKYAFYPVGNTYVKLKGITNNCASERLVPVTVLPKPNILITGDELVCPGQEFKITAQGVVKFNWSTGDTTASISYSPEVATTYYLTGWDENGCVNTTEYKVNVRPLPPLQIQLLSYRGCPGMKDTAVVLAKGGLFYEWSSEPSLDGVVNNKNSEKVMALVDDTTTLFLFGRDEHGCSNETQLVLTPLPHQTVTFEIQPKWIEQSNPSVSMKGVSPTAATWYWNPGDGSEEKEGRLFHYRYNVDDLLDSVEVKVRAVDTVGCSYSGSEFLYVWKDFWAPTGFTPNKDEKNETFHFYGGQYITDFHFYIFNRQGEIVFEGNSFDAEWDGTYKGKDCPWGVYGWVANYNSDVKGTNFSGERKGFITIVR